MFTRFPKLTAITSLMVAGVLVLAACAPAAQPTVAPPTSPPPTTAPEATAVLPTQTPAQPTTAPTAAPTGTQVKNPDTLIEATIGDPQSLDPAWAYDTASGEVIQNVYETLLFLKKDKVDQFVPMLATKWDISQDGKTYTFTIRQAKFQDGQDLTPEDVAYSFWRGMIQDRAGGPQWILLQPFFGLGVQSFKDDVVTRQFKGDWVAAVKAVEQAVTYDNAAGTVTMHLRQPYGPMLQILTGTWAAIVSKPWVIQQGGWDGDPATADKFHDPAADKDELFKVMNGTGPYKLDRWAPGEEVDLSRNDNYWVTQPLWDGGPSGPAKMQRVVIKDVSEWGTRFAMLKTGDADIAYVDTQYIAQVDPLVKETCDASSKCAPTAANGSTLRLFKGLPTVQATTVYFNENVNAAGGNSYLGSGKLDGNGIPADFFSDVNVRKGFNYAFDWNTYIQQTYHGEAEQALGPVIEGELGHDPNQAHYSFDLTKAADAFKASTLKSADGKSLWDTGFYVQYIYNLGNDQRRTAGEILADNLTKINPKFKLSVVGVPFPVELADQTAGRLPIFMLGWLEDYHDPQDWVVPYLATGGTYGGTQHFPKDLQAQMDTLVTQGVQTSDTQARAKIYQQLQNLAHENALDLFAVQPQARHYEQTWVKGWYYNPTYSGQYFYALSK